MVGHGREREREAFMEEVCGSWKFGKDWNFGKLEILVACGGRKRIRKKEKGKEIKKGRYLFELKN